MSGLSYCLHNPFLSERGRSVFLSAFLPEGQESTRASSPALSGPCSRRRQHAQPGALSGVRGPLDRVFPNRCGYPHRGQAHRRSEIGMILPLAPLSPVSRGKIEETDSGKTDYVDNNSTPTTASNLLDAHAVLPWQVSSQSTQCFGPLLCATIGHTSSCYARQSLLSAIIPHPTPLSPSHPRRRATPKRALRPAARSCHGWP